MHSSLNGVLVNLIGMGIAALYLLYSYLQGEKVFAVKPGGWWPTIMAGIVIGFAGIFIVKMFASDVNLSLGSPLVRIGSVILASLLGIFILREGINARYIFGFVIAVVGLVLIFTAK